MQNRLLTLLMLLLSHILIQMIPKLTPFIIFILSFALPCFAKHPKSIKGYVYEGLIGTFGKVILIIETPQLIRTNSDEIEVGTFKIRSYDLRKADLVETEGVRQLDGRIEIQNFPIAGVAGSIVAHWKGKTQFQGEWKNKEGGAITSFTLKPGPPELLKPSSMIKDSINKLRIDLQGMLGQKSAIEMWIESQKEHDSQMAKLFGIRKLTGKYLYATHKIPITLTGVEEKNGRVTLFESDPKSGKETGHFLWQWKEPGPVQGIWVSADEAKTFPVKLKLKAPETVKDPKLPGQQIYQNDALGIRIRFPSYIKLESVEPTLINSIGEQLTKQTSLRFSCDPLLDPERCTLSIDIGPAKDLDDFAKKNGFKQIEGGDWVTVGRHGMTLGAHFKKVGSKQILYGDTATGCYNEQGHYAGLCDMSRAVILDQNKGAAIEAPNGIMGPVFDAILDSFEFL